MINEKEYMGVNDWVWWLGVVEDVFDPMELGRLKVRVFGYYNDDDQALPTEDLPWCYQVMPTTSASHDTHGASPTGLNVGSWVVGWFMDGRKGQFPICFGTIHGIHDTGLAFAPGSAGGGWPGGPGGSGGAPGSTGGSSGGSTPYGPPGTTSRTGAQATPPGNLGQNAQVVMEEFVKAGYSQREAAAVASNFVAESSLDPRAVNSFDAKKSGIYGGRHSFGIAQWNRERFDSLTEFGRSRPGTTWYDVRAADGKVYQVPDLRTQAAFSAQEWNSGAYATSRRNLAAGNYNTAFKQYEGYAGGMQNRTQYINGFDNNFNTNFGEGTTQESVPGYQFDQDAIDKAAEEGQAGYEENETACSADSVPKRGHSLPYKTWTRCDQEQPLSNQSQDKVDELDKTEGQYQKLWHDGEFFWQTPDPKDIGMYPKPQAFSSAGGGYIWGFDDTPGAQRMWEVMPQNGTRRHWDVNGNQEYVITGTNIQDVWGNQYENTDGNRSINAKNVNLHGNEEIAVKGDQGISIHNDGEGGLVISTPGAITFNAGQAMNFNASAFNMMAVDGDINVRAEGEGNFETKYGMNFNAGPGSDPGTEGGIAIDSAGPITMATTTMCCSAESAVKIESPDVNVKGGNMKVDSLSVDETFSTILNWDQTVSSSKFSKYADEAIVAKSEGGNAQASNQQDGEYTKQTPLLSSGTFNSPPEGDPAYPGEKKSGPKGTSMVTRFKEFKDLITQGGKVRGGQRDLGSGGRGVAGHANAGAAPKNLSSDARPIDNPSSTSENFAPRTADAIRSEPGVA